MKELAQEQEDGKVEILAVSLMVRQDQKIPPGLLQQRPPTLNNLDYYYDDPTKEVLLFLYFLD